MKLRLALAFGLVTSPALALDLPLPGASLTRSTAMSATSIRLPDAPWSAEVSPPQVEGAIRRQSFRIPGGTRTTLQLLDPLREALIRDGYISIFTCADAACGGFDFRFQLDIIGEPDMHVDFGDFRYLLMRRDDADPHTVSVVTSRSQSAGFIHITEVSDADFEKTDITTAPTSITAPSPDNLIASLETLGHAVLEDLDFPSGSSDLGPGPFQSLARLADWLTENADFEIAVVGHTDAVGSLEANIALSQQRAQSVVNRLVTSLGADANRIRSEGAGYLSPRNTNQTEEGRAHNRRVEVILLIGG